MGLLYITDEYNNIHTVNYILMSFHVYMHVLIFFFTETSNIGLAIVKGPLEAIGGILYGIIMGVIVWYLPLFSDSVSILLICCCTGLFVASIYYNAVGYVFAGMSGRMT